MSDNFIEASLTIGSILTYIVIMNLWCIRILKKYKKKQGNNYLKEKTLLTSKFKIEVGIFFFLGGIIFFMSIINPKK